MILHCLRISVNVAHGVSQRDMVMTFVIIGKIIVGVLAIALIVAAIVSSLLYAKYKDF